MALRNIHVVISLEGTLEDDLIRINREMDEFVKKFNPFKSAIPNMFKNIYENMGKVLSEAKNLNEEFTKFGKVKPPAIPKIPPVPPQPSTPPVPPMDAAKAILALQKATGQTEAQIQSLINKTKNDFKLDKEFRDAAKAMGLADAEINKIKSSIDEAKAKTASWKSLFSGLAAAGLGALASSFVFNGVKMAADAENMGVQFEVLMGSASAAKATLADLKQFSNSTNFESDQVVKAGRQLLAVNVDAKQLIPTLKMIGDVANGSGKDFNELATIFAKNKSSNFIQGDDLNQMIEAGIPILDEFSKMFGKTAIQVKDMGSKNQITFAHLQQAMTNMTTGTGKYANMTERLSKTSLGMWSTLKDSVNDVGKSIGTNLLGVLRPVLEFFTQGDRAAMRLNMAMGFLAVTIGVGMVMAVRSLNTNLSITAINAIAAYAALILPAVGVAALLAALYLVFEDIYIFFQYGPAMSETYFGDMLKWLGLTNTDMENLSKGFHEFKRVMGEAWENMKAFADSDAGKFVLKLGKWIAIAVAAFAFLPVVIVAAIAVMTTYIIAKWGLITDFISKAWDTAVNFLIKAAILGGKLIIAYLFPVAGLYIFRKEIMATLKFLYDQFKNTDFGKAIIDSFIRMKDAAVQLFKEMISAVGDRFNTLFDFERIKTIIVDSLNEVIHKINNTMNAIPLIKAAWVNIPDIQGRELGGAVQANQMYRVNERQDEFFKPSQSGTVIPLNQMSNYTPASSGKGGNSFNINVTIESAGEGYDAYALVEKIKELLSSPNELAQQRSELGLVA